MVRGCSTLRASENVRECWKTVRRSILGRRRRASPAARQGSSGGSASGRGFLTLGRDVGLVGSRVHQPAELSGVRQTHFDQPRRAVRIAIDFLGRILKFAIGFDHFSRNRRVNLADGLYGLHRAKRLSGFDFRSGLGQLDEDHVAQFMLRVVGDPDGCEPALHVDPLMFFRIAVILWIGHHVTPWILLRPIRIRAEPPLSSAACKTASGPPAPCTSALESPRTEPCPPQNTPSVHKPAQCFFPASAKANRSSPRRWHRPLHCSSNIRRAQFRGRPSQSPPACAAIPPLSPAPAPRAPRNRPFPSCSSAPARLPIH